MEEFVKSICPDFPSDRRVLPTMDWSRFFKIDYNQRCMYVPTTKALRGNLRLVDTFMDAVTAFANADLTAPPNWKDISYETDNGIELAALSLITSLKRRIEESEKPYYMSCDIETRRVEYNDNRVLAIGFGYSWNQASIITVFSKTVCKALQSLYSMSAEQVRWIWHNGKFDTTRLAWLLGIDARVDEDTMLKHYVGINERKGTHGLKELGAIFLQAPDWDAELDKIKKEYCRVHKIKLKDFTYDLIPIEILTKYHVFDCVATYRLNFVLDDVMRPSSCFIYSQLIKASNVYKRVELNGAKIDINYLEDLEWDLEQQIAEDQKEVDEAIKEVWDPIQYAKDTGAKATMTTPFNMASPKQLKWLLETVSKRNLVNTSKEVLEDLFNDVGEQYPVINAIRKLRKANKYMDTYITGFRNVVCGDCRIRGTYKLHGTETGRLSSSEPNMQNIPRDKKIKNLFVADDGCRLVQLDYSQAELRVLAYLSGDEFLTGVYQRGEDLHDAVATKMFGPNFTKEQRVRAKTINFGIAYGRGPKSLTDAFKISMAEAKDLINNWFSQMPDVKKWINAQRNLVYKNITPDTPLGRERHFVVTYESLNHIQNEYVNFPIQSIASDMTMLSLIEIQEWIDKMDLDDRVKIIINVHDSIVMEVEDDKELIDLVVSTATAIMRDIPKKYLPNNEVPFKADADVGYSYGAMEGWGA